jgi:hypothetical protein
MGRVEEDSLQTVCGCVHIFAIPFRPDTDDLAMSIFKAFGAGGDWQAIFTLRDSLQEPPVRLANRWTYCFETVAQCKAHSCGLGIAPWADG